MLLALLLPLNANAVFATTNISDQDTVQINQYTGQNIDNKTVQSFEQPTNQEKVVKNTEKTCENFNIAAGSPSNSVNIAAGSTQSTTTISTPTSFTSSQINDAASRVKTFIESNDRLPNYVTISNVQVTMPQFLLLVTSNLLNINNGLKTSVTLQTVTNPSNSDESITNGNIYKSEYLNIAQTIKTTIETNGITPAYIDSSLGKISYQSLIYSYSRILAFQKTNSRLPNYVAVSAWTSTGSPSEGNNSTGNNSSTSTSLQQYLVATTNAQSTSSTIISLANSITAGLTSDYDKAKAIFNWVRDNISYSYYYNSQKGALGTLSSRTANCCDTSHLVVALARAAGIPARYQHGYCNFSGGWYGHVWAQLYVNGKWYYADAISNSNSFGVINNWSLSSYTLYGTYASLPF